MPSLNDLTRDLRFAGRSLARTRPFTIGVIAVLAFGIGLAVAVFTISNAILRHPLPVADEDRLVVLWGGSNGSMRQLPLSPEHFDRYRRQTRMLSSVAGVLSSTGWPHAVRDGSRPLTLSLAHVTGNFFTVLGSTPAAGRLLRPEDDVTGAAPVAILSTPVWQRAFGGRADVIGRRLVVPARGLTYTIVGVAPAGLEYPIGADMWVPLTGIHVPEVVPLGRLGPGASASQAASELRTSFQHEPAGETDQLQTTARPLAAYIVGEVTPVLWMLSAAAALLLAIACTNVASLLVIRASSRLRETAIRRALGAARRDIVRHALLETTLLALAAGLLGTCLAWGFVRIAVALAPADLPRLDQVRLTGLPIGIALLVTAASALAVGVGPAIWGSRDVSVSLRTNERTATAGKSARSTQDVLVTLQLALAIVVLAGAGLLGRSLIRLASAPTGFAAEHLTISELSWPPDKFGTPKSVAAMYDRFVSRLEALPGVSVAVPVNIGPFTGAAVGWDGWFVPEGQPAGSTHPVFTLAAVGASYFRAMGTPIIRGRDFTQADREDASRVAIVSEAVARQFWPGTDPIGRRLAFGEESTSDRWWTVVGLVPDTRYRALRAQAPTVYVPYRQMGSASTMVTTLLVRTRTDAAAALPVLQRAAQDVDRDIAVLSAERMDALVSNQLQTPRLNAFLLLMFGAGALLLASVGLYSTLSNVVRLRVRELAIRQALGASPSAIRRLLLKQATVMSAAGTAVGLTAAVAGGRAIESLLFEIRPADPLTLAGATLVLVSATLAASYWPMKRATRADVAALLARPSDVVASPARVPASPR